MPETARHNRYHVKMGYIGDGRYEATLTDDWDDVQAKGIGEGPQEALLAAAKQWAGAASDA